MNSGNSGKFFLSRKRVSNNIRYLGERTKDANTEFRSTSITAIEYIFFINVQRGFVDFVTEPKKPMLRKYC